MGVYTYDLLRAMQRIDSRNSYTVFMNPLRTKKLEARPNFATYTTPITIENHAVGDLWRNFYLPYRLRQEGTDIFHDPGYFLPVVSGGYKAIDQ